MGNDFDHNQGQAYSANSKSELACGNNLLLVELHFQSVFEYREELFRFIPLEEELKIMFYEVEYALRGRYALTTCVAQPGG
jgi:hypothetical protein